jgi:hypothetical protein
MPGSAGFAFGAHELNEFPCACTAVQNRYVLDPTQDFLILHLHYENLDITLAPVPHANGVIFNDQVRVSYHGQSVG